MDLVGWLDSPYPVHEGIDIHLVIPHGSTNFQEGQADSIRASPNGQRMWRYVEHAGDLALGEKPPLLA